MKEEKEKTEQKQNRYRGLIPFKPGESGNPEGRPAGMPNRSTIARQVLEMQGKPPEIVLQNLKTMYPKFFEGKSERWQNEFLGYVRMMQAAIIKADVKAFQLVLDSAYGKATETLRIGAEEETIAKLEEIMRALSKKKK